MLCLINVVGCCVTGCSVATAEQRPRSSRPACPFLPHWRSIAIRSEDGSRAPERQRCKLRNHCAIYVAKLIVQSNSNAD